jgi:aminopeptidase C
MANLTSNAYEGVLDVDLSNAERQKVFSDRNVDDAVRHAKAVARSYARTVLNSIEANYRNSFEKSDMELEQVMAQYGVHKALRAYAGKVCRRLVEEKLVR